MARLADKVVLITGGAGGLGSATGRRLAEEGGIVVVADLDDDAGKALAHEIGGEYVRLDVSSEDQWRATVEAVSGRHGRIDVLVNAAGIEGDAINGSIESASLEEWHTVLGVNLDGTFLGCKHVFPVMKQARRGSIVNISSIVSYMSTPATVAYGASKAGVQQLTKSVAISGCQDGMKIRCNSVHPGVMQTRMIDSIMTQVAQALNITREQAEEGAMSRVPFGHVGDPDDVAYLILYLASDESKYVTGSEFMVDGGWHLGQAS
jgi:NAD(P)-dependent dehydrogenase (short-subunit alcohol dehydrogenase family)